MIPDHIIYGSPEECRDALSRPPRCETDPHWRWLDESALQSVSVHDIDAALAARIERTRWTPLPAVTRKR